jgi:hypothetical protein
LIMKSLMAPHRGRSEWATHHLIRRLIAARRRSHLEILVDAPRRRVLAFTDLCSWPT